MAKLDKYQLNLTDEEKAYIAGILDGEGCFRAKIKRYKNKDKITVGASITVGMSDKKTIDWLHSVTGLGSTWVQERGKNKDCWFWQTSSIQSYPIILAVKPYLITKLDEALLLQELIELKDESWGKRLDEKLKLAEALKALK